MTRYQESIDVDAPVELVYRRWSEFERYPQLLADVRAVRRLGDRRLAWRGEVGGNEHDLEVQVTEQTPGRRIAWASEGSPRIAGSVELAPLGDGTRVTLTREKDVEGFWSGLQSTIADRPEDLRADLERFKQSIETEALTARQAGGRPAAAPPIDRAVGELGAAGSRPVPAAGAGMDQPGAVTAVPEPTPPSGGGRGSGSAPAGGAGISQQGGGTGGTVGGAGLREAPGTAREHQEIGGQGGPAPTAGGVAVSQGRGSDLGLTTTGGTLGDDREGMAGGSFGGSRESDVGPGLTDGMRSGQGVDASGAMGSAGDDSPGLPRGQRPPPADPRAIGGGQSQRPGAEGGAEHRHVEVGPDDATGVPPDTARRGPGGDPGASRGKGKKG